MKKTISILLILAFLALGLSACAQKPEPVNSVTPAPGSTVTRSPQNGGKSVSGSSHDTARVTPGPHVIGSQIELTYKDFDDVLSKYKVVLVDFWADWCAPCVQLAPIIEELASQDPEYCAVGKVNIDQQTELAERFKAESIPLLIIFVNGEEFERHVGLTDKETIVSMIERARNQLQP